MNKNAIYLNAILEEDVLNASPHKLISLLYDKCHTCLQTAKLNAKNDEIIKAISIYEYLISCLNHSDEKSATLSRSLGELYHYSIAQLYNAYNNNDKQALDNAINILVTIQSAWQGIQSKVEK